jgi:hypothetical protein
MGFDRPVLLAKIVERIEQARVCMRMPGRIHGLADAGDRTNRGNRLAPQASKSKSLLGKPPRDAIVTERAQHFQTAADVGSLNGQT